MQNAEQQVRPYAGLLDAPLGGRVAKPRRSGLTMVLDKGLGLTATRDLLELAAPYIDFIKLGFGTSALYPPRLLQQKVELVRSFGVHVYPGGTLLEAAVLQGRGAAVLGRYPALGFTAAEISDGTVPVDPDTRRALIARAREMGLRVLTEVGRKDTAAQPEPGLLVEQARLDLDWGADHVIIEGRESGTGVGIYDRSGAVRETDLETLARLLPAAEVIWEAPRPEQQQALVARFGTNVSLGNVPPTDVVALEAIRAGLRSDTLRLALVPVPK